MWLVGGIGRHIPLKTERRKAWGFKSLTGYQSLDVDVAVEGADPSRMGEVSTALML